MVHDIINRVIKMSDVILIDGYVNYQINLDPTVWIFDERRFPLEERIPGEKGLAMELAPFIKHAKPQEGAKEVRIHRHERESLLLPLSVVEHAVLLFARNDRPLSTGGPAWLYPLSGPYKHQAIDFITRLEVLSP